ncbi:MAG: hypothetical protein QW409_00365 [Candidatus Aenigmatarchaeota archaeon]
MANISELLVLIVLSSLTILPLMFSSKNYQLVGDFQKIGALPEITSSSSDEFSKVSRNLSPEICKERVSNAGATIEISVNNLENNIVAEITRVTSNNKVYARISSKESVYSVVTNNITCELISGNEKEILSLTSSKGRLTMGYVNGSYFEETYGMASKLDDLVRYCRKELNNTKELIISIINTSSCLSGKFNI